MFLDHYLDLTHQTGLTQRRILDHHHCMLQKGETVTERGKEGRGGGREVGVPMFIPNVCHLPHAT